VNYYGPRQVGNRSGDTIVDPNNPLLAIDDPSVDDQTLIKSPAYIKGTGTLSYTVQLAERKRLAPKSIQFDLTIDNLFDRSAPLYNSAASSTATSNGTAFVPRNDDVSNPARVTVRNNPSYLAPRNYMLSAKLNF
jgi:hypothetical protein